MIFRGTPKNPNDYIKVKSEMSMYLHSKGFTPKYIDNEFVYYIKTANIEQVVKSMERGDE